MRLSWKPFATSAKIAPCTSPLQIVVPISVEGRGLLLAVEWLDLAALDGAGVDHRVVGSAGGEHVVGVGAVPVGPVQDVELVGTALLAQMLERLGDLRRLG